MEGAVPAEAARVLGGQLWGWVRSPCVCLSPDPGRPSSPRGCGVSDGHTVSSGHWGFWLQQRRSHLLELQYFKRAFV